MKLDNDTLEIFLNAGIRKQYRPGEIVYMQDEETRSIYAVLKGRVRIYSITESGEEITYEVLGKGRIFGESSFFQNSHRPTTAVAVNNVELAVCSFKQLYPCICDDPSLALSIMTMMSETCDYLVSLIRSSYTCNRYEKVASFLLRQTEKDNKDKGIIDDTIPFTHEEISNTIGLSRGTVTRILNEFAKKGYVKNKYGKVQVIDKESLYNIIRV